LPLGAQTYASGQCPESEEIGLTFLQRGSNISLCYGFHSSVAFCDEPRDAGSGHQILPLLRRDGIDLFYCILRKGRHVEILPCAIGSPWCRQDSSPTLYCPRNKGDLGRNALRGFGVTQVDLTLRRQFKLREGLSLKTRADFFNIFNHPNIGNPINYLTPPQFGQST
jgi:hypothetical protein